MSIVILGNLLIRMMRRPLKLCQFRTLDSSHSLPAPKASFTNPLVCSECVSVFLNCVTAKLITHSYIMGFNGYSVTHYLSYSLFFPLY